MTVSVNGVEISDAAINLESANYEGASIPERQHQAAVALVVRELLRQRAEQLGMPLPDPPGEAGTAEDARIDALIEREVSTPEPDEAACRAYFENNRARFRTPDVIEARHILLAVPPDDLEGRDRARDLAEALIQTLGSDPDAFARLAREHSTCHSREQGGHLGQLSRGQTVPEFEDAVLRLPVGLAQRPIETRYGWHVVEVLHRAGAEPLPFESVRGRIAEYLEERSRRRALSQYLRILLADADVRGIDLEAAESPLLQ